MQTIDRPTPVLVIAIFHFIIGGLGLVCDMCGVAGLAAGRASAFSFQTDPKQVQMQKDLQDQLEKNIPGYHAVQLVNIVMALAFDAALIAAGFGLLKMAAWGRTLSIAYGSVSLAQKIALAIWSVLFVLPATAAALNAMLGQAQTAQERQIMEIAVMSGKIGGLAGACFPMIYPFVVLLIMNLASVKAAFNRERPTFVGGAAPDYQDPFRPASDQPPDERFTR